MQRTTSEPSGRGVARQIGPIWPVIVLFGIGAGIVGPSLKYMRLNFFARDHTSLGADFIHCSETPEEQYCRDAVTEDLRWTVTLGVISSIVHFVVAPMLGTLSDAWGRRPLLIACAALGLAPAVAQTLFVYFDVSLYISFALSPLASLPVGSLFFAYITDRVSDTRSRVVAFGLVAAGLESVVLLGLLVGVMLPMRAGFAVSVCTSVGSLLYIVFFLPESLPRERRSKVRIQAMVPISGLSILWRNPLFMMLTFMLVVSSFCNVGFSDVKNSYLQKYLPWTIKATYLSVLAGLTSSLLWMGCFLRWLTARLGNVGVMMFAQAANATYCLLFGFVSDNWQVWALNGILLGPMALFFPAVSALTSSLVSDSEQGQLQGAMGTVKAVAEALGPIFFGKVFERSNEAGQWTPHSRSVFYWAFAMSIPSLIVLALLPHWLERHPPVVRSKHSDLAAPLCKEDRGARRHSEPLGQLVGIAAEGPPRDQPTKGWRSF